MPLYLIPVFLNPMRDGNCDPGNSEDLRNQVFLNPMRDGNMWLATSVISWRKVFLNPMRDGNSVSCASNCTCS